MEKFLDYVEKHQNDFVERLRKAVAIPRYKEREKEKKSWLATKTRVY